MAVRPHPSFDHPNPPSFAESQPAERAPRHALPRPALRLVAPPSGPPGMAFVVLSALAALALVLGLVVMNVLVAQQSFRLHDVTASVEREEIRSQQLRYAVAAADSPAAIAEAAHRLGLVAPERQEFILRPARALPAAPGGGGASGDTRAGP